MYYTYILFSIQLNRYYIGHTSDLSIRINQHNNGDSSYTSKARDWELKWSETFASREEAFQRERAIKKKKSRQYIEKLIDGRRI